MLTGVELLRKLAPLVPPPRQNLTRYHGVFAPNAKWNGDDGLTSGVHFCSGWYSGISCGPRLAPAESGGVGMAALSGDVAAVVVDGSDLLVADRHSRTLRFSVKATDFALSSDDGPPRIDGAYTSGDGDSFEVLVGGAVNRAFTVDHCGRANLVHNSEHHRSPRAKLDPSITVAHSGPASAHPALVRKADVDEQLVPHCDAFAQTKSDQVACLKIAHSNEDVAVVFFDLSTHATKVVPVPIPTGNNIWLVSLVATEGPTGVLVTTDTGGEDGVKRHVFLVTEDDAEQVLVVEVPDFVWSSAGNEPLFLTDDGHVVMAAWGHIFVSHSGTHGISDVRYPRGPYVGGNENRGAVASP